MTQSRVRQLQRKATGRLAQLFEDSALWKSHCGARAPEQGGVRTLLTNATGLALGLPVFNRRVRQYNTGRADPKVVEALGQRPGWQFDRAAVADGVRLAGAVARPREKGAGWILYFLGNWGDQLLASQRQLEELRGSADFGLAMWAPRGFEASEGAPNLGDFCADAMTLHRRLVEEFSARPSAIHLVGFSMGALVASALATALAQRGTPAASLSLLSFHPCGFAVRKKSQRWYAPWLFPEWYLPAIAPDALPDPILVVHGTKDPLEPVEDTRAFVASLGDRCRYLELPDGNHQATIGSEGLSAVRKFIAAVPKASKA